MKITNLAIIFVIIALPFTLLLRIKTTSLNYEAYKRQNLDIILDAAVHDATLQLIRIGKNHQPVVEKERAVEAFFHTLYLNFNVMMDKGDQKKIMGYVPLLVIVDYDGYYVYSSHEYTHFEGHKVINHVWKPKIPYTYSDGTYLYSFTLNDYLEVYKFPKDNGAPIIYKGTYEELKKAKDEEGNILIRSEIIQDPLNKNLFDTIRRRTIIHSLQKEVNYRINNHNHIARQFGITYNFSLPIIEEEDWHRTIDDISIMAFFQGMPLGIGEKRYNSFSLGGARVVKGKYYYIYKFEEESHSFYHRYSCPLIKDIEINEKTIVDTRKKAAKKGALPCNKCNP